MAFLDALGKKISQTGQDVVQKTKDTAEIIKYNTMISDEERRINEFYAQIGKTYVDLHADSYEIPFTEKEHQDLYRELQSLPAKYRSVIHLFYYEELSVEEIGHILNRKPATVRTQLTRARELLRGMLKEEDYDF